MKKVLTSFLLVFISLNVFAVSLKELLEKALTDNIDIQTQRNVYQNSLLSKEGTDGIYAPSLSVSGNVTMPDSYNFSSLPPSITAQLSYGQKITSGTSLQIDTAYQRTGPTYTYSDTIKHDVSVSLSLSQNLNPYWAQKGNMGNPDKVAKFYDSEKNYYVYLNTIKTVFTNIIQNYIRFIESQKQIKICNNNLSVIDKRISAFNALFQNGEINKSEITNLQNERFNLEQELYSYSLNSLSALQTLSSLCSAPLQPKDISYSEFNEEVDDIYLYVSEVLDNNMTPELDSIKAQIKSAENSLVLIREQGSPVLNIGIKPSWTITSYSEANQYNTTVSVSTDLSPLFLSLSDRQEQKVSENIESMKQLLFLNEANNKAEKANTERILLLYKEQQKELEKLLSEDEKNLTSYRTEYIRGEVSLLDYEIQKYRVENHKHLLGCINLNIWLYELLMKI